MLFCSQNFFLFFVVIFCVYWALPWRQPRVWLLLAASFFFYATWSAWLASTSRPSPSAIFRRCAKTLGARSRSSSQPGQVSSGPRPKEILRWVSCADMSG